MLRDPINSVLVRASAASDSYPSCCPIEHSLGEDKHWGFGTRIDRNDTSHFIPLGLSVEYQVGPTIAFSSTLMVNLHHITLSPPVPNDSTSMALLFGIRWGS